MRERGQTVERRGVQGGLQQKTRHKICKEIGQPKEIVREDAETRNSLNVQLLMPRA